MAFAGIFQPFTRLRWIRFGLLMRDRKFSRRFSVPQTTALARMALLASPDVGVRVRAFLESFDSPERVTNQLVLLNSALLSSSFVSTSSSYSRLFTLAAKQLPSLAQSRFAREI